MVPEENNKHTLELVGPTLVAIGCELEPRPPFLIVRERFCDSDALEAFYARQEAFKQDLWTDKEWLEPVFQADGTSRDQLIARLSCTDPIVTNAPDRMEEPVQAESAYPPQPAPLAAQEEYQAPAGDPPAALSQEAPVPPSMRLSPAPSHTAPPPQPYHGQFSVQPVQHAPQPLPAPDFSHPAPAPAQYLPVNPNGAPQQNSFPPQRNSYPLQQNAYPPQQNG